MWPDFDNFKTLRLHKVHNLCSSTSEHTIKLFQLILISHFYHIAGWQEVLEEPSVRQEAQREACQEGGPTVNDRFYHE